MNHSNDMNLKQVRERIYDSEYKKAREAYQKYKAFALDRYLDPVDFPQEVKQKLQRLSAESVALQPEKSKEQILKEMERDQARRDKKYANRSEVQKAVLAHFPDYEIAAELNDLRSYDREGHNELFEKSPFRTKTEARQYFTKGNKHRKDIIRHQNILRRLRTKHSTLEKLLATKEGDDEYNRADFKEVSERIEEIEQTLKELGM